ncbi:MAG: hypothetical protein JXB88_20675 [Spirochaetales bacterium]|nr:hypothetical protein [Spirochaetales bacterium]
MKCRIINIIIIILVAAITFFIGQEKGKTDLLKHFNQPAGYMENLIQLDKSLLKNILTRPCKMTSGTYVLETNFPGKIPEVYTLELAFSNGQLIKKYQVIDKNFVTNGFMQEGKIVYGNFNDMNEKPGRIYIGLMDGDIIWSKVCIPGSYGWHVSSLEAGVFRMYKKV